MKSLESNQALLKAAITRKRDLLLARRPEADPEVWTITNGKLYVFSKKPAIPKFKEAPVAISEKAGENWRQLRASNA